MTFMWLDHANLLLSTMPRLVADPTKSILFPLILNPAIIEEILVLESIIHLNFEGLIHNLFAEAQLSSLYNSRIIECKQETIFSLRVLANL